MPQSVRQRAYKASGKYTSHSLVLMLGLGGLAGIVIGAVAHYVGLVVPVVADVGVELLEALFELLGGNLLWTVMWGLLVLVFAILLGGALGLCYPMGVGAAVGFVTWRLAKWGKCRSAGWVALIVAVNGTVAYAAFALVAISTSGRLHLTSAVDIALGLESEGGAPWWLCALFALDALLLIGSALGQSVDQVESTPFCETCDAWYGPRKQGTFSTRLAEPLIQALESANVGCLENAVSRVAKTGGPRLLLGIRKCPSCAASDVELSASVLWREEKPTKDGTTFDDKNEVWFETMIGVQLGAALEGSLFGEMEASETDCQEPGSPFEER